MERRRAVRVASQCDTPASETTAASTRERVAPEPRFPHGMRNDATAYALSASTDMVAYEDLLGHYLLEVRNLIATTNDESYHGSASDVPAVPRCRELLVGLL
jgi:site-specific recombinase XerC